MAGGSELSRELAARRLGEPAHRSREGRWGLGYRRDRRFAEQGNVKCFGVLECFASCHQFFTIVGKRLGFWVYKIGVCRSLNL